MLVSIYNRLTCYNFSGIQVINRLIADKAPLNRYLQSLEEIHNDTSLGGKLREYEEEIIVIVISSHIWIMNNFGIDNSKLK